MITGSGFSASVWDWSLPRGMVTCQRSRADRGIGETVKDGKVYKADEPLLPVKELQR